MLSCLPLQKFGGDFMRGKWEMREVEQKEETDNCQIVC